MLLVQVWKSWPPVSWETSRSRAVRSVRTRSSALARGARPAGTVIWQVPVFSAPAGTAAPAVPTRVAVGTGDPAGVAGRVVVGTTGEMRAGVALGAVLDAGASQRRIV